MSTISQKSPSSSLFFVTEGPRGSLGKRSIKQLESSPVVAIATAFLSPKQEVHILTPPLTGSFAVGHSAFLVKGPKNPIGVELSSPTSGFTSMKAAEYTLFPGHILGSPSKPLATRAVDGIAPLQDRRFPVVIISHGFGLEPGEYRALAEEIASHGFVVLTLLHPYSAAHASYESPGEIDELPDSRVSGKQAKDIAYIIAAGREKKGETFTLLNKIADFNHVVLIGHALGGTAAIRVARKDPGIRACINIDGPLYGMTEALEVPLLLLVSGRKYKDQLSTEQKADLEAMDADWKMLKKASKRAKMQILSEADHDDFLLLPLLKEALLPKIDASHSRRILHETAAAILAFIKKS